MIFTEEALKEIEEAVVRGTIRAQEIINRANDKLCGWEEIEAFTKKNKRFLQEQVRRGFFMVDGEPAISYNKKEAWGSKRLIIKAESMRR